MTDAPCQRWRARRDCYRPAGECFDPRAYGVEAVPDRAARAFVVEHHYSGSYPAARARAGLVRVSPIGSRALVGVAVFSVPMSQRIIPLHTGLVDPSAGVELGRFVLLDSVAGNGETWFLRRAFALARADLDVRAVIAYSDPVVRTTADGRIVKPGHLGIIYQAHNGRFLGRASASTLWISPSGRAVPPRAVSKIRNGERGAAYSERLLVDLGAPPRAFGEDPREWVVSVLASGVFRRVRHPGNLVYAWPLERGVERRMPVGVAYPKAYTLASAA